MPLLVPPDDYQEWLDGDGLLSFLEPYSEADYYLERTDECWASGTPLDDDPAGK